MLLVLMLLLLCLLVLFIHLLLLAQLGLCCCTTRERATSGSFSSGHLLHQSRATCFLLPLSGLFSAEFGACELHLLH